MSPRLIRLGVAVIALGTSACAGDASAKADAGAAPQEAFRPLDVGDTVPSYKTITLDGKPVQVAPGEPITLVNIWATWCESCKEEMSDLEQINKDYKAKGVRVLAVSVDQAPTAKVARFIESIETSFLVAHDRQAEIQQLYRATGVPATYLVAADGRLLWKYTGGLHGSAELVRNAIDEALR